MENRNLFRINDTTRRQKLLKQGRLPVVSFVSEMPRTRHLWNTFTMDISLATVSSYLLQVVVIYVYVIYYYLYMKNIYYNLFLIYTASNDVHHDNGLLPRA